MTGRLLTGAWVDRLMTRPTPRCLWWLDRLEDRCPVWALPWMLLGGIAGLPILVFAVVPRLLAWLR